MTAMEGCSSNSRLLHWQLELELSTKRDLNLNTQNVKHKELPTASPAGAAAGRHAGHGGPGSGV